MKIREFIAEMDKLYPRSLSAPWDTDGLQCCADPDRELERVLVALDATKKEIDIACNGGYDLLLTHHPMIFGKAGDIVPWRINGNRIIKLLSAGVATASFHTRLDVGSGGVNDCLANVLGLTDIRSFGDDEMPEVGRIGELTAPMEAKAFAVYVKDTLNADSVKYTGNNVIKRVAVVGGAGKDYISPALAAGADCIVTGEVSYNSAIDEAESGITVIEAGHYHTEHPVCYRLAELVNNISGAKAVVLDQCAQNII